MAKLLIHRNKLWKWGSIILFPRIIFLVFLFQLSAFGQSKTFKGQVVEALSNVPLPYVHIILYPGKHEFLTDEEGRFQCDLDTIQSIQFKLDLYRTLTLENPFTTTGSCVVQLTKYIPFTYLESTDIACQTLISKVIEQKKKIDFERKGNFSYRTYNKFFLDHEIKDQTPDYLKWAVQWMFPRIKSFDKDHQLFFIETTSYRRFKNEVYQQETITGNRVSGIQEPSIMALASGLQHFSIFKDIVKIGLQEYVGPLHYRAFHRYDYQLVDTISLRNDTLFVVRFFPKKGTHFEAAKGYLYVSSKTFAIRKVRMSPLEPSFFYMDVVQTYNQDSSGTCFPSATHTYLTYEEWGKNRKLIHGQGHTFYFDIQKNQTFHHRSFNENLITYDSASGQKDSLFWVSNRKLTYSAKDENTIQFYKKAIGEIQSAERWIRLGENLYYGKLPIGPITLDINKIITYNLYENWRYGFGMHTNEKFSRWWSVGGYLNYGSGDKAYKYGGFGWVMLEPTLNLKLHYSHTLDVSEPGISTFAFDIPQFSSEPLRKYQANVYDMTKKNETALSLHPFHNLDLKIGYVHSIRNPTYSYSFENQRSNFTSSEVYLSTRWAYGEKFFQSVHERWRLGTPFPVFYLLATKGFSGILDSQFDYLKLEMKAEASRQIIGYGTSYIQLYGGFLTGSVPYAFQFVPKGAYRNFSVVIHNSFETMRYNEFVGDNLFTYHYAHRFGRLRIFSKWFRPEFEMLHSGGWMKKSTVNQSSNVGLDSMEKGYFESGIFVNNILSLKLSSIRLGFGLGAFMRYGPYRKTSLEDNLVTKMSINFYW